MCVKRIKTKISHQIIQHNIGSLLKIKSSKLGSHEMCSVKDLELLQRPNITLLQFQKMFLTDKFEQRGPKTGSRPGSGSATIRRGRPKKLKIQDGKYVEVGDDEVLEEIDPKVFANSNGLPTYTKKRNKKEKEKAVATKYKAPAD